MATLADTYLPDDGTLLAEAKAYLGITDGSEDTSLALWLDAAVRLGDFYLGRDWTDADGVDETQPDSLKAGIFEVVGQLRRLSADQDPTANRIKTAQLEVGRSVTLLQGSPALRAALPFWRPHARGIWRRGDSLL